MAFVRLVFSVSVPAHVTALATVRFAKSYLTTSKVALSLRWCALRLQGPQATFAALGKCAEHTYRSKPHLVPRHSMLSSSHALTGGSRRPFAFASASRPTVHGLKVALHFELLAPTLHLSLVCLLSCLGGGFARRGADYAESGPPPLHAHLVDTALTISCCFSFAISQEKGLQGQLIAHFVRHTGAAGRLRA